MKAQVRFDKEAYFPGDIVKAQIEVFGHFHGRARSLQIFIHSGEKVGVTYTSHSGKHSSRRTAWETRYYNGVQQNHSMDQITDYFSTEMKYQLPNFHTEQIQTHKLTIFHEVQIKLDISMGSDERIYYPIPIFPHGLSPIIIKSINQEFPYEGAQVDFGGVPTSISPLFGHATEIVKLQFPSKIEKNYRSIRIELVEKIWKQARRHRTTKTRKYLLARVQKGEPLPTEVRLPATAVSSISGINFSINHTIKLVRDVALMGDENDDVPFFYHRVPRDEMPRYTDKQIVPYGGAVCDECGEKNASDNEFCSKCGSKLHVGDKFDVTGFENQKFTKSKYYSGQNIMESKEFGMDEYDEDTPDDLLCSTCGDEILPDSIFCDNCGTKIN